MGGKMQLIFGANGQPMTVDAICFHNSNAVSAWQSDYSEAQLLLSDFATGLGSIGFLGFVVASSVAVGLLESLVTKASQKKGVEITYEEYEPGRDDARGIGRTSELTLWALDSTPETDELRHMAEAGAEPPRLLAHGAQLHEAEVFCVWALPMTCPLRSGPS